MFTEVEYVKSFSQTNPKLGLDSGSAIISGLETWIHFFYKLIR